jgi:hypothetical protein
MLLDSVIKRVFAVHIKSIDLEGNLPQPESLDFQNDETGSQYFLPSDLQVQWLKTRLRFWDARTNWKIVNTFGNIYSSWLCWKGLKAKLESLLFGSLKVGWRLDLQGLEESTRQETKELANLTISLTDQILRASGLSYIKQCQLRFGAQPWLLLNPIISSTTIRATSLDIENLISNVFRQSHVDHFSKKKYLAGFRKLDDYSFVFTDWDWVEFETMFEPLKLFHLSEIGGLQDSCSLRSSLCKLQPQGRKWEWVTII